jgi:hypothetical protein
MLYIYTSSSVVDVKISAVHFKDGLSSGYGGAIRNAELLTLESCIFSGNQNTATSTSYGGGAVHSSASLTIRGCTFYNNACSSSAGGAIIFTGSSSYTLTLTGNLFYENAAATYPVVRVSSTGIVNASYNVVDAPFGAGTTDCGWAAGTGDKTLSDLSIIGSPFVDTTAFVPITDTGLNSVITTKPQDFPDTDFYGTTRTFAGSPGAVK